MINIEDYNYELPEGLIRKQGVEPRDSARLFVYDTKTDAVTHATFRDLATFLPKDSLMVLNNTKVVPARLYLKKETGGKIEVLVLANEMNNSVIPASETGSGGSGSRIKCGMTVDEIPVLVDRKCRVGWKLYFPNQDYFEVVRQEENRFFVMLRSEKSLDELLQEYGETPIPHYLEADEKNETDLRKRYQTIFAQEGASVAAPTASLHFTEQVFMDLDKSGVEFVEVTLDVGLGTFAPLKDEHFESGKLHAERISVSEEAAEAVNRAKREGRHIIAVGTTAMRTLESVAQSLVEEKSQSLLSLWKGRGKADVVQAFSSETDIFIYPPYRFQTADILLTNFHLPKSSLMLLVDAFLEDKKAKRRILDLYDIAIQENYAFYSFGDSMLII